MSAGSSAANLLRGNTTWHPADLAAASVSASTCGPNATNQVSVPASLTYWLTAGGETRSPAVKSTNTTRGRDVSMNDLADSASRADHDVVARALPRSHLTFVVKIKSRKSRQTDPGGSSELRVNRAACGSAETRCRVDSMIVITSILCSGGLSVEASCIVPGRERL